MSLIYVKDTAQNSADLENKEKCNKGCLPKHEFNKDNNRHAKWTGKKNETSTRLKDLHITKQCRETLFPRQKHTNW